MWAEDSESDPPRVIFTPSEVVGNVAKIVYDPESDAKWVVHYVDILNGNATLQDLRQELGL